MLVGSRGHQDALARCSGRWAQRQQRLPKCRAEESREVSRSVQCSQRAVQYRAENGRVNKK